MVSGDAKECLAVHVSPRLRGRLHGRLWMRFATRLGWLAVGGVRQLLGPPLLPDDFGTAQVIGQLARAAGAGGRRVPGHDLFHARINSRSCGGAAGAEPAQQQPHVEVTVRLDDRLPALPGKSKALQVPSFARNSALRALHCVHAQ
jgi:hypothetical protein